MKKYTTTQTAILAGTGVALLLIGGLAGHGLRSTTTDNAATAQPSINAIAAKASAGKHNAADLMFAQMTLPHHTQAVEMSKLAAQRAGSPAVKKPATEIAAAQQPEITTMEG